jgi:hypothetical protein
MIEETEFSTLWHTLVRNEAGCLLTKSLTFTTVLL